MEATSVPKVIKTNAKTGYEQIMNTVNNSFSLMCKTCEFIVNTIVFKGLTGCERKRKMIHKTSKNDTKVHFELDLKSMQNQCSKK